MQDTSHYLLQVCLCRLTTSERTSYSKEIASLSSTRPVWETSGDQHEYHVHLQTHEVPNSYFYLGALPVQTSTECLCFSHLLSTGAPWAPSLPATSSHHYLQPSPGGHLLPTGQRVYNTANIILTSWRLHFSVPKTRQIKASAPFIFSRACADWLHCLFWKRLNFTVWPEPQQ